MGLSDILKKTLPILAGGAAGALTGGLLAPAAAAGTGAAVGAGTGVAGTAANTAASTAADAVANAAPQVIQETAKPGMFADMGRELAKQAAGSVTAATVADQLNGGAPAPLKQIIRKERYDPRRRGMDAYDSTMGRM